jgi:hypothetical protein
MSIGKFIFAVVSFCVREIHQPAACVQIVSTSAVLTITSRFHVVAFVFTCFELQILFRVLYRVYIYNIFVFQLYYTIVVCYRRQQKVKENIHKTS